MQYTVSVLLNRLLARGKFRHVQVLLRLAELGSVQRTADAIGLTQSSVTHILGTLEELLEVPLFERHARGVRPTAACLDLLPMARLMFSSISESAETVVAHRQDGAGVVRVIASASAVNGLLAEALPAFCRLHPRLQVQLREAEGEDLLLAIGRGEVDLVVCRRPHVLPQQWAYHPVAEDRLVAVCAAGHRLAARRRLAWQEVERERWLPAPAGSVARVALDEIGGRFSKPPRTYPVVTRILTAIVQLLRDEGLLALVPLSFIRPALDAAQVAVLPLPDIPRLDPVGILMPAAGMREAPAALAAFMRARGGDASPAH